MLQVCQPCISLHIIHSSQIQKCTVIGLGVPEIHTTRWLASVLIVFLKRLADFMKKMKCCTIPTWPKFNFLHRNSKLVILTKYPKSCIDHWKSVGTLISYKSFEQELMILCKIHEISVAYNFLRGLERMERGGGGRGRGLFAVGTNKISKLRPESCNKSKHGGHSKGIGSLKIQYDMSWGSRGFPNLMKHTIRLNLWMGIGYRVIQTRTTIQIARKTGELVN